MQSEETDAEQHRDRVQRFDTHMSLKVQAAPSGLSNGQVPADK